MSQAINELWNEFYTMVGPADAESLVMLHGAFYAGSTAMLEHLILENAILKSALPLVVGVLQELEVSTPSKMN